MHATVGQFTSCFLAGMVVFLWIRVVMMPPAVSMPRLRGATSKQEQVRHLLRCLSTEDGSLQEDTQCAESYYFGEMAPCPRPAHLNLTHCLVLPKSCCHLSC